jgi:hypothetical protein
MPQPVPHAENAHPAVPAPHTPDHSSAIDSDPLCFADVEHAVAQEVELDAATTAWDGFL